MRNPSDSKVKTFKNKQAGFSRITYLIPFLLALLISTSVYSQEEKSINAVTSTSPIKLDGLLRETAWENAEVISGFTQRELHEGEAPTEKTEVKILYDENNLYFGIICYDSEPDKIVHNELMWDGELLDDDHFTVVLDTFNDKRTGYVLCINPNGARVDGLIKNIEEINIDWTGIPHIKITGTNNSKIFFQQVQIMIFIKLKQGFFLRKSRLFWDA
ncbi:MAG: carbohydrate binding family 9 domain-containing protein [Candidatus Latescibacteria bacterium]|nr:carbohydrate binding family 9 domain-containing protein [Candidatus Latescibacterota bacterium]